jgi:hypothetical protein
MPLTKDADENRLRILANRYAEMRDKLDDLDLESENEAIIDAIDDLVQALDDADDAIEENEDQEEPGDE